MMNADHQESRQQIIALMRGQAACPIIASLAKLGIAERMLNGSFTTASFANICNCDVLEACITYLVSLGLTESASGAGEYRLTKLGESIFRRSGAFLLMFSYHRYFDTISNSLQGITDPSILVDRELNVAGSGSLHRRKYFPVLTEFFRERRPNCLIDLGCGNGAFLEYACSLWPTLTVAAIDLSPIAIRLTSERMSTIAKNLESTAVENVVSVKRWSTQIPDAMKQSRPFVISLWFVAHEFSEGRPERLIHFFRELHSAMEGAEILLGEIVKIPAEVLARNPRTSIMPEFLFFHELSGQGVIAWSEWKQVLNSIPYTLASSRTFDEVDDAHGELIPSSFVWHLRPI